MKIAVFHNLPSGGAKRALYGNLKELSKNHEIDVFIPSTANEDYLPLKDVVNNIKIYPVKNDFISLIHSSLTCYPSKISLINLNKTQKLISDDINKNNYDVVLCEQDRYTMAPFLLKYIKKPFVYYCQQPNCFRYEISKDLYKLSGLEYKNLVHGLYLRLYGSKMIRHDKKYANYAKNILVNSYFTKELVYKYYKIKSNVSYLGVDNKLFKPINVLKENYLLSIGQCIPEKGFDFIIRSISEINPHIRPKLVIVTDQGNPHWKKYLIELAMKLKVELKILHLITDEELVMLYNKAKLIVYAPYKEPFGLVPLESMSCGTPVVAVNEGGIKETVLNNKTGILTDRNTKNFANSIEILLKDDELADKMAEESLNNSNNFWTVENSGSRLLTHLYKAIEDH